MYKENCVLTSSATEKHQIIRSQIEFYFGDSNIRKDRFLRQKIADSVDGWVPLSLLATFRRLQNINATVSDIAKAFAISPPSTTSTRHSPSTVVELSADGLMIRRLPRENEGEERPPYEATIFIDNVPKTVDHEKLAAVCASYGTVCHIQMPRFRDSREFKGIAFVEFANPDEAHSATAELDGTWPTEWPEEDRHDKTLRVCMHAKWVEQRKLYEARRRPNFATLDPNCSGKTPQISKESTDVPVLNLPVLDIPPNNPPLHQSSEGGEAERKRGAVDEQPRCSEMLPPAKRMCTGLELKELSQGNKIPCADFFQRRQPASSAVGSIQSCSENAAPDVPPSGQEVEIILDTGCGSYELSQSTGCIVRLGGLRPPISTLAIIHFVKHCLCPRYVDYTPMSSEAYIRFASPLDVHYFVKDCSISKRRLGLTLPTIDVLQPGKEEVDYWRSRKK